MKRGFLIFIWTLIFFFGSSIFLGYASGLYFAWSGTPSKTTTTLIGVSWALVPMISGPLGFLLGFFGILPGTKKRVEKFGADLPAKTVL